MAQPISSQSVNDAVARAGRPLSASRATSLWWALGPGNPLVRLEWVVWRRRPVRHFLLGLLFVACIGAVFVARTGYPRGTGGYSTTLYRVMAGPGLARGQGVSAARRIAASIATELEKGIVRLTTILPWLLVIRSVRRVRRSGMWEPLRVTALTPRDWVAGLAGPPILLGALALAIFLAAVVLPDFLARYGTYPDYLRGSYRLSLAATIPLIGLEGASNSVLVAAATLHESLRSQRTSDVILRSMLWILAIELVHALVLHGIAYGMPSFRPGTSYPRYLFLTHSGQLTVLAATKLVPGLWWFRWIARTLPVHVWREGE